MGRLAHLHIPDGFVAEFGGCFLGGLRFEMAPHKAADILHFSPKAKLRTLKTGLDYLERALIHTWLDSKEKSFESIKKAQGYLSGRALPELLRHHLQGDADLPKLEKIKEEGAFKMLSLLRHQRLEKNWDALEKIFQTPPKAYAKDGWFWHEAYLYHAETQNWAAAQKSLDKCASLKATSEASLGLMQSKIFHAQADLEQSQIKKLELLERAFKSSAANLDATMAYAKLLKAQKDISTLKKVLTKAWKAHPTWNIAEVYADLTAKSPSHLAKSHAIRELHDLMPNNLTSHVCLVISLLKARLWGEAATIIEKIDHPSTKACLKLLLDAKEKSQDQVSLDQLKPFLATLDLLKFDIKDL